MACSDSDEELFMFDEGNKTYCFILWKLYNRVVNGDTKNPYTGNKIDSSVIQEIYKKYSQLGPWEKLRHEQPRFRTRGLTVEQVIELKLMQFGIIPRPLNYELKDNPVLIIGTIPLVPKHQETIFAARLGINSDIIVSPRKIDTVVNLRDYKGMMTVCNIWEDCKLPDKQWASIYFNHIPMGTSEEVISTLSRLVKKIAIEGVLIYQTDIQLDISEDWKKLQKIAKHFQNVSIGISSWNEGYYCWMVLS